ncbi:MAG TPA: metalloregulator ArsR/SmtB family transcription factor [Thermoanaerobaculia bacterium]
MDSLDLAMAAAADPTRRAILARLAEGPASVTDLARPFRMTQQAVSKHVACLERARLIQKRRAGRHQICTLNPKPLEQIAGWAEGFRELWTANYRRLDLLLDGLADEEKKRRRPSTKPDRGGSR